MFALLLFAAGCEQPPTDEPLDTPKTSTAQPEPDKKNLTPAAPGKPTENSSAKNEKTEQTLNVKVYYPDDSGMKLVEVEREIVVDDKTDKYTAAVETLTEEPLEENLTRIFPKNAAIRSVKVEDGLATVDLDGSIKKGFVGGSTGEEFLIGSVVDTLTNFPEVKSVKFLVDGKEVESLSGHMDLSAPLERMTSLTK